ncbi:MAG: uncharacterized protein PWQ12_751 [Clostridiales bacterium]|nr:uncharacterized protein [Clostridiales bacterium]
MDCPFVVQSREVSVIARPRKWKRVCGMPHITSFIAENRISDEEQQLFERPSLLTRLTVEEYEVVRLIDRENLTQEECALQMEVSRPTVQILYNEARKKIAAFLTEGGRLEIEGGSYKLCSDDCDVKRCGNNMEKNGYGRGHRGLGKGLGKGHGHGQGR